MRLNVRVDSPAKLPTHRQTFSAQTLEVCERGFAVSGERYVEARRAVDNFRAQAAQLFTGVDVLLTPTTPGEAPAGKSYAGDPRLQELWTMLHLPSITIPAGRGRRNLPLGVQLVARPYDDSSFWRTPSGCRPSWAASKSATRLALDGMIHPVKLSIRRVDWCRQFHYWNSYTLLIRTELSGRADEQERAGDPKPSDAAYPRDGPRVPKDRLLGGHDNFPSGPAECPA